MIKLLLVDDHTLMRRLLVDELSAVEDFEVVGDLSTGEQALEKAALLAPDVIVMDVSLPGKDGIETTALMRAGGSETPILCLTMHFSRQILNRALKAGVNGYLLKHDAFDDLIYAIRKVSEGSNYVSPQFMTRALTSDEQPDTDDGTRLDRLTEREREIIVQIANSRKTSEIADILSISERTVDAHRRNILAKTDLKQIAEITRFALRTGLVTDD